MNSAVASFAFLILITVLGSALGFAYFREGAPICTFEYAETFKTNQYCQCQGWEVTRFDNRTEDSGYKETVCLGKVQEVYCKKDIRGEVFDTECL